MLGLITPREWLWLGIIVAVVSFATYEHVHLINEGEARCLNREKAAAEKQAIADTKIAQDTTDELQREISRLRSATAPGAPSAPVRVQCYARPVPAAQGVPGAARPGEPATRRAVVPEVSRGAGGGPDLEPSLQRLALAADIVSARDRACIKELREP